MAFAFQLSGSSRSGFTNLGTHNLLTLRSRVVECRLHSCTATGSKQRGSKKTNRNRSPRSRIKNPGRYVLKNLTQPKKPTRSEKENEPPTYGLGPLFSGRDFCILSHDHKWHRFPFQRQLLCTCRKGIGHHEVCGLSTLLQGLT